MAITQRTRWFSHPLIILLILVGIGINTSCSQIYPSVSVGNEINSTPTATDVPELIQVIEVNDPPPTSLAGKPTQIQVTEIPFVATESPPSNGNLYVPLLGFPIPEEASRLIESTYRFGSTLMGERIAHDGVEMLNPEGTPVLAAADGKVYFSGDDRNLKRGRFTNFYGNIIIIEHLFPDYAYPVYTFYAHLSSLDVKEGDSVKKGERIGSVGASGKAFTNHLHFEVRIGDVLLQNARNPELFLPLLRTKDQPKVGILIGSLTSLAGNPITGASVVIQKMVDGVLQPGTAIYVETYAKTISSEENWGENFVVGSLPIGEYRVSAFAYQYFVEKIITIKDGEFTTVHLKPEE
jgi:murein DD-endopeptidase MepM/ murein hydrolase activator NlpD